MLLAATWFIRAVTLLVICVATFRQSPAGPGVLAAQIVWCAGSGIVIALLIRDAARPGVRASSRWVTAGLAFMASAGTMYAAPGGGWMLGLPIMAALTAGSDLDLLAGWAVAAIGILAIELGCLIWSADTVAVLGLPLLVLLALLSGHNRRVYRLQAEQGRALLAQSEQLRLQQQRVAVLGERTRIAREVHDVLAHSLGALSIQVQSARALLTDRGDVPASLVLLEGAQRMVSDGLVETRRALHVLRDDPEPLAEQLTRITEAHRAHHDVAVDVDIAGSSRELPPDATLALVRTAQESLVNAAKYGAGQPLGLAVSYAPRDVTLTVTNVLLAATTRTGQAFETANAGYGLTGLRERLLLLGGTLSAGPRDGAWVVRAQVPR